MPRPHDKRIHDLLFALSVWHACAKLRCPTDSTLSTLRSQTREVGRQLRDFLRTTCSDFDTRELPKELAARGRRKARKAAAGETLPETTSKTVYLNLDTIKYHYMAKYVDAIKHFGTADSYTTQTVRTSLNVKSLSKLSMN